MHDTKITCKSIRKRNNLIDNEQNQTLQITNKDMKICLISLIQKYKMKE